MKCLNLVEGFFIEFLSLDGFSAGLDDLVLAHYVSQRKISTKELGNELTEISMLMKHVRGGTYDNYIISQVEKHLLGVQENVTKAISSSSSFFLMVDNGNVRSTNVIYLGG